MEVDELVTKFLFLSGFSSSPPRDKETLITEMQSQEQKKRLIEVIEKSVFFLKEFF